MDDMLGDCSGVARIKIDLLHRLDKATIVPNVSLASDSKPIRNSVRWQARGSFVHGPLHGFPHLQRIHVAPFR